MKPCIQIGQRKIGDEHPPFVIAEIGINHEGSMDKAKQMIHDASKNGAECVKFQTHVIEDEMIPDAKNIIPENANESIWNIMERCSFTQEQDIELKKYVENLGMIYLSTPFSRAAANRLQEMNVTAFKIGSGECNNYPLIEHIASFKKPVILSTGMNDLNSVSQSVKILKKHNTPYALLHCTSMYPTPYEHVRLGALKKIKDAFPDAIIGLSDHSLGNYTCFAAVALEASILEKHFTSDKNWPGPDVPISINPAGLNDLINGVNAIYKAMGGEKNVLSHEEPTINFAYACVVTTQDISKGEKFTKNNIWVKRPGTGEIKAAQYNNINGKTASSDIKNNSQLKWDHIM